MVVWDEHAMISEPSYCHTNGSPRIAINDSAVKFRLNNRVWTANAINDCKNHSWTICSSYVNAMIECFKFPFIICLRVTTGFFEQYGAIQIPEHELQVHSLLGHPHISPQLQTFRSEFFWRWPAVKHVLFC